ncbi:MAG: phosphate acyltransferase PlsX [Candidatus Omnitrophica bacterium]|nr:phosphate acyltransferase PlsX [Candidatus Omnitrophota bacterium]
MKIIVDAMGGDFAPEVVVAGAIEAVTEYQVNVVLVGDQEKIKRLLDKHKYNGTLISIHPAAETIDMSESAAASVRRKRQSSIVVGVDLVKEEQGDAFFSAGNTGAVVCASVLAMGLLPGVERPGIAIVAPTLKDISLVIDVGANIDPKPLHLLQYGIMGDAYARYILKKTNPTVGLLNIGEEETKGTDFVKETHELLSKSSLNFIGNLEGKYLFSGKADIVICDGFVGNIALKVSESLAETVNVFLKQYILSTFWGRLGALMLKPSLMGFKKKLDYSEYGGAPLLGVNGVVIIGHGRSNAHAIKNAIRVAKEEVENKFNEKIIEAVGMRK